MKRWRRGTPLHSAETVFAGESSDVAVGAAYDSTPGFERHLISRATDFYNAEISELRDGRLVRIDVPSDAGMSLVRQWLLVFTRSEWTLPQRTYPAGTLLAFDYETYLAGHRDAVVLFTPDAHTCLENFGATRNYLILTTLKDVRTQVHTVPLDDLTAAPTPIDGLPDDATVGVGAANPHESDEIFATATSFTQPATLLHGSIGEAVLPLKSAPAVFDADGLTVQQFFATSDDGTRIPYFVVRQRDSHTSGPTLLYGYGGFENSLLPGYSGIVGRNWLARGGTYVLANLRGGGEYGPTWHTQVLTENRHKVNQDFAAVARDLVSRGIATTSSLGAQGGSNGGLLMGVMATAYPELFGAIVCQVPLIDMRRYHQLLAGASWMAEYGDPDDPQQWEFIAKYSPYHNVSEDGPRVPILITTSTKDDRVHPGHARKFAARLEEVGAPVRYFENIEGGHGGAADNRQSAQMSSLAYEFLWRTLSDAASP